MAYTQLPIAVLLDSASEHLSCSKSNVVRAGGIGKWISKAIDQSICKGRLLQRLADLAAVIILYILSARIIVALRRVRPKGQ